MIRFGILGAADIAPRSLVHPCLDEPRATIRSIAARDRERAEGFASWHNIPVVHDRYEDVVSDPDVDAVYIPLPITLHHRWTIEALRAGKHVLCEKSMAANGDEAREMAEVAKATDLVLMDAFHYRYHPVFLRAKELVDSGRLGAIRTIDAVFNVPVADPTNIRNKYALGGGVTMDIGCYPISWVRHLTGEEPDRVSADAEIGAEYVDTYLRSELTFPSGIRATTSGDMRSSTRICMSLTVTGTNGRINVENPLAPQLGHRIDIDIDGQTTVEQLDRRPSYGYQLDAFLAAVEQGTPLATDAEDAVKQMDLIDRCYEAAGLPRRGLDQSELG